MSVPAELKSVTRKFIEQLLLCRPTDTISFAIQYYSDERARSPKLAHAVHSLMFLLRRPMEFRSAVGTIYCTEVSISDESKADTIASSSSGSSNSKTKEGSTEIEAGAGGGTTTDGSDPSSASASGRSTTAFDEDEMPGDASPVPVPSASSAPPTVPAQIVAERKAVAAATVNVVNTISALHKLARSAIQAAMGEVVNSENEAGDWICTLIESVVGNGLGLDAKAAVASNTELDFETCVAMLRSYLSLRIIAGCVHDMSMKRSQTSSYLVEAKKGSLPQQDSASSPASLKMEISTTVFVQPEDIALLQQILNATLAKDDKDPGLYDSRKTVTAVINQYMSLLK